MKGFMKFIIAVVIVGAICFGVYCMLPERSQKQIDAVIQKMTDDDAVEHIDKIKNLTVSGYDVTYETGLNKLCKSSAWYYEYVSDSVWKVTYYGSKASVDMTTDGMDQVYTNANLTIVFTVRNNSAVDIEMTIGDDAVTSDTAKAAMYKKIATAD